MELVELFDILFLKYINAAGALCNPQATFPNILPLPICTDMRRDRFLATKKLLGLSLCFEHVTYVSSTERDSVLGAEEKSEWMGSGKPAEARGSWGQAERCFWRSWPSLCPPGSQDVQGSAGPGFSADVSLLGMVFGLLPVCWLFGLICQVLGGLHSSVVCWCLWEPHLLRCGATP